MGLLHFIVSVDGLASGEGKRDWNNKKIPFFFLTLFSISGQMQSK